MTKTSVQVFRVRVLPLLLGTVQLHQGPASSSGLFHACPEAEGEERTSGALGEHLKKDEHKWLEGAVRHHSALSCSLLGWFGKLKWGFLGPFISKCLELK